MALLLVKRREKQLTAMIDARSGRYVLVHAVIIRVANAAQNAFPPAHRYRPAETPYNIQSMTEESMSESML
ncbi:hypothetical protein LJR031_002616 [Caballeronia sp. LjRoot31]